MTLEKSNKLRPPQSAVTKDKIAEFQAALLNSLYHSETPTDFQNNLELETVLAIFDDYVETFEPRMTQTAIELVKKWGKQRPE